VQEQVRGEAILGWRPAGLVGSGVVGEQDAAVDDRAVGESGEVVAE
jgi:hypothetical protein